jgi:hypothetical protein
MKRAVKLVLSRAGAFRDPGDSRVLG